MQEKVGDIDEAKRSLPPKRICPCGEVSSVLARNRY